MKTQKSITPSEMGIAELYLSSDIVALPKEATLVGCLMVSTPLFVWGEILFKQTAETGKFTYFVGGTAVCTLANILYLQVIRDGLAVGFLLTTCAMTLAVLASGVWLFGETMNVQKWAACVFMLIASALLALPENQATASILAANANGEF
ncbi:MAG: hypothetical protein QNI84_14120 [Henriciella sp.]|nr:hypothetical protein [Henriciella sp.]